MRILIIGCGFLGQNIAKYLSDTGKYSVELVSRSPAEVDGCLKNKVYLSDYSLRSFKEILRPRDVIINCAGPSDFMCKANVENCIRDRQSIASNLMAAANVRGAQLVVNFSTMRVFNFSEIGQLFNFNSVCPDGPYAQSHIAAEKMFLSTRSTSTSFINLRLGNVIDHPQIYKKSFLTSFVPSICLDGLNHQKIEIASTENKIRTFITINEIISVINHFVNTARANEGRVVLLNGSVNRNLSVLDVARCCQTNCERELGLNVKLEHRILDEKLERFDFSDNFLEFQTNEIVQFDDIVRKIVHHLSGMV